MEAAAALLAIADCAALLDGKTEWDRSDGIRERREIASAITRKTWLCVRTCGTDRVFTAQNAVLDCLCRLRSTRRPRESPQNLRDALLEWQDALAQQAADTAVPQSGHSYPLSPLYRSPVSPPELLPQLSSCEACTFHVSILALVAGAYHPAYLFLTSRRLILRPCLPEGVHVRPVEIPVLLFKCLDITDVASDASTNRSHQTITLTCKNTWTLSFSVRDKHIADYVFRRLQCYLPERYERSKFFAYEFYSSMKEVVPSFNAHAEIESDLSRIIANARAEGKWRVSHVNSKYDVSDTMPPFCIVPRDFRDADVRRLAEFRILKRFPTVSWIHPTSGACLVRASQPAVGVFRKRCDLDERYMHWIRMKNGVAVLDARPLTNAIANLAKGGGYINYPAIERVNADIGNIHAMSKSLAQLRKVLHASHHAVNDLAARMKKVSWLKHIQRIVHVSVQVAKMLEDSTSVLVHCTNGWDRTSQIVSLANLMLDPFYRTKRGFLLLVEKDWIEAGHKFRERSLGKDGKAEHKNVHRKKGISPIFPQFLESVVQLIHQFPTAFEFNEPFLRYIALTPWDGTTGTYMYNSSKERAARRGETLNFFDYMNWLVSAPMQQQAKTDVTVPQTAPEQRIDSVLEATLPMPGPPEVPAAGALLHSDVIGAVPSSDEHAACGLGTTEDVTAPPDDSLHYTELVPSVDLTALGGHRCTPPAAHDVPIVDTARKPWLGGALPEPEACDASQGAFTQLSPQPCDAMYRSLVDAEQLLCEVDTSAKPSTDRDYLETTDKPSETDGDASQHDRRLPRPASMIASMDHLVARASRRASPKRRDTYPYARSVCIDDEGEDGYVHIYLEEFKGGLSCDPERSCSGLTSTPCSSSQGASPRRDGTCAPIAAASCVGSQAVPSSSRSAASLQRAPVGHSAEDVVLASSFHNGDYKAAPHPLYPSFKESDLVVWVEYHDPYHSFEDYVRSMQREREASVLTDTILSTGSNSSWVCVEGSIVRYRGPGSACAESFTSHAKSCMSHPPTAVGSSAAQSQGDAPRSTLTVEAGDVGASSPCESLSQPLHDATSEVHTACSPVLASPLVHLYPSAPPSPMRPRSCSSQSYMSASPVYGQLANPDCQTLENSQFNSRFIGDPQGAAARWVPDGEAKNCLSCERAFTMFARRHHCRRCGQIFCGKCSKKRAHNGTSKVRVCDGCFAAIAVLSCASRSSPRSRTSEWSIR